MPLQIVRNDITTMKVDAIVNAANESLLGGGGVDGAIHRAAGPELLVECRTLGGCKTGEAKITKGYRLPAKFVIHTVGPIWRGGSHRERELLVSAYRSSLEVALAHGCETVAFPLISSGVYGYPKNQALKVAVDTIGDFLLAHDMTVYLVIFDRTAYTIGGKLFADIAAYIDDRYVDAHTDSRETQRRRMAMASIAMEEEEWMPAPCASASFGLDEALSKLDESFSQMLLRKIDEQGMTDAQCYKKANIDRKLFSKIRSDVHYKPSKPTAMTFAIALELPQEEVQEKSRKICERLAASDWYHNSAVIYGYYPLGAEADCLPFLAQALSDGKTVALPVTSKERLQRDCGQVKRMQDTHRMEFYRIRELSRVREGAFHVMEPDESCKRIGEEDAVVLVPGLVFDRKGNRYGYGGGYYDRYFARFPKLSRMAVAFEGQIEEQLAVLPTDVRMHRIYTEEREYRI